MTININDYYVNEENIGSCVYAFLIFFYNWMEIINDPSNYLNVNPHHFYELYFYLGKLPIILIAYLYEKSF